MKSIEPDMGKISNPEGLPLPTTFGGKRAQNGLIDGTEQLHRRNLMARICGACHARDRVERHFQQMERHIREADAMVASTTTLMQQAWSKKQADPDNPFDEALEFQWIEQWLFFRRFRPLRRGHERTR